MLPSYDPYTRIAGARSDRGTAISSRSNRRLPEGPSKVQKVLARHGRSLDGTSEQDDAEPSGEQLSLSALCAAAASGQGLFEERAGKPLLRVVDPKRARSGERVGESLGINVHAEVVVPPRDRARLERLCRYVCRPPIAQNRLEETEGGKLSYLLKKPWRDGTVALVLEPMDLIARVCALIPPPRQPRVFTVRFP